jgi:hypothetical protein
MPSIIVSINNHVHGTRFLLHDITGFELYDRSHVRSPSVYYRTFGFLPKGARGAFSLDRAEVSVDGGFLAAA